MTIKSAANGLVTGDSSRASTKTSSEGSAGSITLRMGTTRLRSRQSAALEREVKELRKANEILKLASAFFAQAELDRRLK
ncbi:hypothetical protein D3C81_710090 [compost metagenome]|nr:hypothetical protein LMG19282_00111 [Cupriavidus campinensis]